jgi:hypothetical protein
MAEQYISELVSGACGRTGHITWVGIGADKRVAEVSDAVNHDPGPPPTFACVDCGTAHQAV